VRLFFQMKSISIYLSILRFLARRASCRKRGRDGTKYSRFHPANYLSHQLAGIVTAAVFADAARIVEEIARSAAQDPRRLTRVSALAYSPVLLNPAGFEPLIPPVSNSGPVCHSYVGRLQTAHRVPSVAFPHTSP